MAPPKDHSRSDSIRARLAKHQAKDDFESLMGDAMGTLLQSQAHVSDSVTGLVTRVATVEKDVRALTVRVDELEEPEEIPGVTDAGALQEAARQWRERYENEIADAAEAEGRAKAATLRAEAAEARWNDVSRKALRIVLSLAALVAAAGGAIVAAQQIAK
jgi:hypothetical protein